MRNADARGDDSGESGGVAAPALNSVVAEDDADADDDADAALRRRRALAPTTPEIAFRTVLLERFLAFCFFAFACFAFSSELVLAPTVMCCSSSSEMCLGKILDEN